MKLVYVIMANIVACSFIGQNATFSSGKYSTSHVLKKFDKQYFITVLESDPDYPTYSITRSTIGSSGSSRSFSLNNTTYYVSQSIGQSSVIGTYSAQRYILMQGYQQPLHTASSTGLVTEHKLRATVFPNPFSYFVNIQFHDQISSEISVMLVDISGRTMLSKQFAASSQINLLLGDIPNGIYALKISSGNKTFSAKLLKE